MEDMEDCTNSTNVRMRIFMESGVLIAMISPGVVSGSRWNDCYRSGSIGELNPRMNKLVTVENHGVFRGGPRGPYRQYICSVMGWELPRASELLVDVQFELPDSISLGSWIL